jgi:hypothetical protein
MRLALPKLREGRFVPGKLFSGLGQEVPSEGVGGNILSKTGSSRASAFEGEGADKRTVRRRR